MGGRDPGERQRNPGRLAAAGGRRRRQQRRQGRLGGVCGPKGVLQDVTFRLYALRHKLSLQSGFNPSQVRSALKGDTLGAGLTLATYTR